MAVIDDTATDDEALWCDPPARAKPSWVTRLEPCLNRPGKWRRVWDTASSNSAGATVSNLRRVGAFRKPPGRWEFSAGQIDHETWGVWARWMGDDD